MQGQPDLHSESLSTEQNKQKTTIFKKNKAIPDAAKQMEKEILNFTDENVNGVSHYQINTRLLKRLKKLPYILGPRKTPKININ